MRAIPYVCVFSGSFGKVTDRHNTVQPCFHEALSGTRTCGCQKDATLVRILGGIHFRVCVCETAQASFISCNLS